jgi:hypothetical protein
MSDSAQFLKAFVQSLIVVYIFSNYLNAITVVYNVLGRREGESEHMANLCEIT